MAVNTVTSPALYAWQRRRAQVVNYVGLVRVMSWKNFQVRYKRAVLGVLWAVMQPAFQAAVLSFVFLKIFKYHPVPHYPLYVLSGIIPWSFFASSVLASTTAVVDNAALVKKVALPLSVFTVSAAGGTAIAFSASLTVLVIATLIYGTFSVTVLLLPLAVMLELYLIIAVALITGAFHVAFRDVKYVVESSLVVGIYASPILYSISRLSDTVQWVIRCNPITGVLSLSRAAILGRPVDVAAVLTSLAVTTVLFAIGSVVFHRRAGEFADIV
jgi:lipopolysaccharide transport system permease protein